MASIARVHRTCDMVKVTEKKIDMFHILATFTQERKKMVVFYK